MLGRYHRYYATVRPWLWFLSRTADCRIFQELTVPDIVKQVFERPGVADFKLELTNPTASGPTASSTARPTSTSSAG